MILAQVTPSMSDADFNWHFWQMVFTIGSPALNIVGILWGLNHVAKMKVGPQPFRIELEKEFASKDELRTQRAEAERDQAKLEQRMTRLEHKLDADKDDIIKAGQERSRAIHDRIDTVLKAVSRVEGAIEEARTHR